MRYLYALVLLSCIIPRVAQGNKQEVHQAYSLWDIVTIITRLTPVTEMEASQIPFIPNLENCVRCERKGYITKDGMAIDVLAFQTDKSIKRFAITIASQPRDKCISISQVIEKYKFKNTDKYVDGLEGGDHFYGGYQRKIGALSITFLSKISISDNINFVDRCVNVISLFYDQK